METAPNTSPATLPVQQPPQQEVPVQQPSQVAPVQQEEKKKKSDILTIILIILLLLMIIGGILFAYKEGYLDKVLEAIGIQKQEQQEETEDTQQNEEENEEEGSYFEGETVKALLPDGWSMKEYYDGEGSDSLVSGGTTYEGLTGLKIFKDDVEIFNLRAVTGIGVVGCPMYTKFADYNPQHLSENENMAEEMGDPINIRDYTNTQYTEITWLGKTFRRINLDYTYDDVPGNNYFEPTCMLGLLTLDGLNFTVKTPGMEDYEGEAYFYGFKDNVTVEDAQIVDGILESMTLQN